MVAVSAEDGVSRMTLQHVHICRTLKIPIIIVITKIDHFQSSKQHNDLIISIKGMLNKFGIKFSYDMNLEMFTDKKPLDDEKQAIVFNHFTASDTHTPIFKVSSKTGQNIQNLINFLFRLPPLTRVGSSIGPVAIHSESLEKFIVQQQLEYLFFVYRPFFVKGIGWIVHGCNKGLPIKKGTTLKLGPIGSVYREVRIRSIHSEVKEELDVLPTGISGCLALKAIGSKKDTFNRNDFTRGKILTDRPFFVKQIRALIEVSNQHGTVSIYPGYTSLIVCGNYENQSQDRNRGR
jgi:GTPase